MATAGSIVIDLLMKTGAFETDSKRAEKRLRELQKTAKQFGVAVGSAVVAAGAALTTVTVQAIQFADQIDEMSQRIGVSTEQLSGWAYAAKLSGTSLDSLTNALPKLSKNMAAAQDEGSRLGQLFKAIGVDTVDAAGNLRDVEDVLPDLADRFKALDNDTLEAALAMELFGRSGAELLEFLNRGSDGIKTLTDRAAQLGIVIGTDTAANAAEFNDRLDDLAAMGMAFGIILADELLPSLIALTEWFIEADTEGSNLEKTATGVATGLSVIADTAFRAYQGLSAVVNAIIGLQAKWINFVSKIPQFKLADSLIFDGAIGRQSGILADSSFANAQEGVQGLMNGSDIGRGTYIDPTGALKSNTPESGDVAARIKAMQEQIKAFLENPTGGTGTGGGAAKKSEAEQEAERLQQAYDSLNASLERQAFFLGKTGEEAQVRYETELGALSELEPALKEQLLAKAALLDAEIAAREEAEKQEELDKRATEAFEQMNGSILEQIELIGMAADEQEIFNALAWLGADAEQWRKDAITENIKLLQAMREEMNEQIEAMDAVRDAGRQFLGDLFDGSKSFKDSFLDALDSINQRLLQMISDNLIEQLLGKDGDPAGGSAGGWFSNLFSGLFGGSRAGGGDTISGRSYLVGEQGPEMFVPRSAGTIIPAEQTAAMRSGGGSVTQNIQFNLPGRYDMRTQQQIQADMANAGRKSLARGTAG